MKKRRSKMYAPRLKSGEIRDRFFSHLAPEIKAGLQAIADFEKKSMAWVVEEVIIDYFQLKRPNYKEKSK